MIEPPRPVFVEGYIKTIAVALQRDLRGGPCTL